MAHKHRKGFHKSKKERRKGILNKKREMLKKLGIPVTSETLHQPISVLLYGDSKDDTQ